MKGLPPFISPDCRDGNHTKCPGYTWDTVIDTLVTCGDTCGCYERNWPEGGTNNHERPADQ